ncbi:hypothetical protein Cpir12675_006589 [Ceratocystis pirilliformis]|uniref:Protein ral2 n=1 Tax=Ceratocystis pirilliformis TaxID=259994 RepID=A0ABR3YH91_9PEZI
MSLRGPNTKSNIDEDISIFSKPDPENTTTTTPQQLSLPSPSKSPGDLFSGVYRGFKSKLNASSRDDPAKSQRFPDKKPSPLQLQDSTSATLASVSLPESVPPTVSTVASTVASTAIFTASSTLDSASASTPIQPSDSASSLLSPAYVPPLHKRGFSLQQSLEKPLPEPPFFSSSFEFLPPIHQSQTLLDSVFSDKSNPNSTPSPDLPASRDPLDKTPPQTPENKEVEVRRRSHTMDSNMPSSSGVYGHDGSHYDANQSHSHSHSQSQSNLDIDRRHNNSAGLSPSFHQQPRTPNSSLSSATTAGPTSASTPASVSASTPASNSEAPPAANSASAHLSGLMCNVHKTTGREPHPLVGVTTTIVGDKLYIFGGRHVSRNRQGPLTSAMYELDLISRHWTKLTTTGDIPAPRYFHSMCALGHTKMVCYGGMAAMTGNGEDPPSVVSDVYIYDIPTKRWSFIPVPEAPQGRYAHCATVLDSSAVFTSHKAPLSALQHNPASATNPNEGRIGINIDGSGGAEMVILGGQDAENHYIEEISVFNLRSLKWTSTQSLGKSCGAYRSVVAALPPAVAAKIGRPNNTQRSDAAAKDAASSMLIYSNYNFLDVKLELQIRAPDGSLTEKAMSGSHTPPGLRFPNGGVIDTHFVVSGTYLTSSKQEYALWALDLKTLTWNRIDAGGTVFSHGSWNKGILWNRRNTFVILGNRKRSLVEDYNHRRINFSNVCMVELEAFGFYDNPRHSSPMSGFVSASSPYTAPNLSLARKTGHTAAGRQNSRAADELGEKLLGMREVCDMDILCIEGERIPINSRIVSRRWGPYFNQLLREGTTTQDTSDALTLRSGMSGTTVRSPAVNSSRSTASESTLGSSSSAGKPPSTSASSVSNGSATFGAEDPNTYSSPTPRTLNPTSRPRCLYLPHTYLTAQALVHYLYTSSLPASTSTICTPQILCSLLQIARPYKVDGLLEAVVERLHMVLDSRNAAAVFNATAMAAGGGRGIDGSLNPNYTGSDSETVTAGGLTSLDHLMDHMTMGSSAADAAAQSQEATRTAALRINTSVSHPGPSHRPSQESLSASTSVSGSEWSSELGETETPAASKAAGSTNELWMGELSSVIGLQKRGLRGLMEGRRMRERTGTNASMSASSGGLYLQQHSRVGLGIAGQ